MPCCVDIDLPNGILDAWVKAEFGEVRVFQKQANGQVLMITMQKLQSWTTISLTSASDNILQKTDEGYHCKVEDIGDSDNNTDNTSLPTTPEGTPAQVVVWTSETEDQDQSSDCDGCISPRLSLQRAPKRKRLNKDRDSPRTNQNSDLETPGRKVARYGLVTVTNDKNPSKPVDGVEKLNVASSIWLKTKSPKKSPSESQTQTIDVNNADESVFPHGIHDDKSSGVSHAESVAISEEDLNWKWEEGKPNKCPLCGLSLKYLASKNNLTEHLQNQHNISLNDFEAIVKERKTLHDQKLTLENTCKSNSNLENRNWLCCKICCKESINVSSLFQHMDEHADHLKYSEIIEEIYTKVGKFMDKDKETRFLRARGKVRGFHCVLCESDHQDSSTFLKHLISTHNMNKVIYNKVIEDLKNFAKSRTDNTPAVDENSSVEQKNIKLKKYVRKNKRTPPPEPYILSDEELASIPREYGGCLLCGKMCDTPQKLNCHLYQCHKVGTNKQRAVLQEAPEKRRTALDELWELAKTQMIKSGRHCPVCFVGVLDHEKLISHIEIHENLEEYQEQLAVMKKNLELSKTFRSLGKIKVDALKTEGESGLGKPGEVKCAICDNYYSTGQNLRKHINVVHNLVWIDYINILSLPGEAKNRKLLDLKEQSVQRSKDKSVKKQEMYNRDSATVDMVACTKCDLVLGVGLYRQHLSDNHPETENIDGIIFDIETALEETTYNKVNDIEVSCPYCENAFSRIQIMKHLKLMHGQEQDIDVKLELVREEIRRVIHQNRTIARDLRMKTNLRYGCRYCKCGYLDISTRSHHENYLCPQNPDRKKLWTCKYCGRKGITEEWYNEHIKLHDPEGPNFICAACGLGYRNRSGLNSHIQQHHLQKTRYRCEECDKDFFLSTHYKSHMRKHKDLRDHTCSMCRKAFKSQGCLKRHMKTVHLKQYPYKCDKCEHGVDKIENLKKHVCGRVKQQIPDVDPSIDLKTLMQSSLQTKTKKRLLPKLQVKKDKLDSSKRADSEPVFSFPLISILKRVSNKDLTSSSSTATKQSVQSKTQDSVPIQQQTMPLIGQNKATAWLQGSGSEPVVVLQSASEVHPGNMRMSTDGTDVNVSSSHPQCISNVLPLTGQSGLSGTTLNPSHVNTLKKEPLPTGGQTISSMTPSNIWAVTRTTDNPSLMEISPEPTIREVFINENGEIISGIKQKLDAVRMKQELDAVDMNQELDAVGIKHELGSVESGIKDVTGESAGSMNSIIIRTSEDGLHGTSSIIEFPSYVWIDTNSDLK